MVRSLLLSTALLALRATAQSASPFTDDKTGITFNGYQDASGYRFGLALPETPGADFIGQIVGPVNSTGGWAGISMSPSMTDSLLIVAWPNGDEVVSSFRKATGYTSPPVVTGDFTMTPIPEGTYTNETAFSYTFLCSGCVSSDGGLDLLADTTVLGWALSAEALGNPTLASSVLTYHAAGFGAFGLAVADAKSSDYSKWAAMATGGGNSTTPTTPGGNSTSPIGGGSPTNGNATISNATYDYIVAGAGAAGIIVAGRLVESGASVLLLERGGPSSASTGNTDTLSWNSSVTMYDVPGLDYYLSTARTPAFYTDTADQAGCLLGGGTMVNAMMFVRPQDKDFDDKWPAGWKWSDVSAAADRLYERNPGQTYGSIDGVRYDNQAYDFLSEFLSCNGFSSVDAIKEPNAKNNVFSHPPWSTANGLRAGPVRNYLPIAQAKSNFKLMLNTKVVRAVRDGPTVSGVETENENDQRVIYNIKSGGGVILAAGALSTPRILFNSGIGPTEQIQTVASGFSKVTLPAESDWINLPVGVELRDHPIFTVKFSTKGPMPALSSTAFTSPNDTTVELFAEGSGILAQFGQRLTFWTTVETSDGNTVYVQGTCNGPSNNTVSMKIYLTHGLTSVGSLGITADGVTEYINRPWLTSDIDKEAATIFMDRLLDMTRKPNSTLSFLSAGASGGLTRKNVTGADIIKQFTTGAHFVSTAKMGEDEKTAVVDTNTKVFGTDDLFVVDASMHPDLPTGNTQAIVMVAAEAAVPRILALKGSPNGPPDAVSSSLPIETVIPPPSGNPAVSAPGYPTMPTRGSARESLPPRPYRGKAKSRRAKPTPTTLQTAPDTPAASLEARVPVSPDVLDDSESVFERSERERASFLDSYSY